MSAILERYLDFVDRTEPRENFHRWSFLACASAALGRNIYFNFGHMTVYPNQYVFIVGNPAARKSTSIKILRSILADSGFTKFSYTKTSKQKFLIDFSLGFDSTLSGGAKCAADLLDEQWTTGQEVFVCNDEIVDFLGVGNFDMASLLANLWDNLDHYDERLKNSDSVRIENPTVNILGGITPTSMHIALPKEAAGQGFMSRLILVFADSVKRKITFPKAPDPHERQYFVDFFAKLRKFKGEMVLTPKAEEVLDEMYNRWTNTIDVRLEYYAGRRFIHLLKLCMILAALDDSLIINENHAIEANTILLFTEKDMAHALGEYGQSRHSEAIQKVISALSNAPNFTMDYMDLWKQVMLDVNDIRDLHQIINNLRQANRVKVHDGSLVTLVKEIPLDVEGLVDFTKYIREYSHVEKNQ